MSIYRYIYTYVYIEKEIGAGPGARDSIETRRPSLFAPRFLFCLLVCFVLPAAQRRRGKTTFTVFRFEELPICFCAKIAQGGFEFLHAGQFSHKGSRWKIKHGVRFEHTMLGIEILRRPRNKPPSNGFGRESRCPL